MNIRKCWKDMVKRCQPENQVGQLESYKGCFLNDAWLGYEAFHDWYRSRICVTPTIDKDIIKRANKEYGPETCLVVPSSINKSFQLRGNGPLPGIKIVIGGKYSARYTDEFGTERARNFTCMFEAHKFWQLMKANHIERLLESYILSDEVNFHVRNRINLLRNDAESGVVTGDYL